MEKDLLEKTLKRLDIGRKELSEIDLEITKKALPELDEIIEHISAPLMIMVMGEFSSGKSTFINAMVGQEVTAVNATPTTAVITKLCYGAEDRILVHFMDGREEEFETSSFEQLTAKTGITGEDRTHASIEYVERQLPLEMLKYVTIIDSPGLNDINEQHSDTTKKFVHNSDTVLWMFSALQPGSKTEIEAMELLSPRLKPIAIVNKMDEIDEEEDDPEEFLENLRVQLKEKVQAVVGISAKYALEGILENDEDKKEIGNLRELEKVVSSLIFPNRDKLKLNSFMDELGEWVDFFASCIKETRDINQRNQDADYDEYLDLKIKLQHSSEALAGIVGSIKEYVVDESKQFNEQAMYLMGVLYDQGVLFVEDDKLAEQYLEAAALKNHTLAQTSLGAIYYFKNEFKKAKLWLEKAVLQNNKLAFSLLGLIYLTDEKTGKLNLQKENADKAVALLEKAASLGEDHAQYFLYNLLINKDADSDINSERAYGYLMQAAENGNENALVTLGKLYAGSFEEEGDKEDIIKSVEFFSRAANYGSAEAIFNLGEIYRKFWANEDRMEKSFQWYKKAALLGNAEAQYWIARYYDTGSGVEKDPGQAFIWYKKSAEQDYIDAQCSLAIYYRDGIGVEKNIAQTCFWLEKAGNLGNVDAQLWLANYYQNNNEMGKAFTWYMHAAEQGNAEAQNMVGRCYKEGWGVDKDVFSAFDWYRKAAEQGNTSAAYNLAICYQNGNGAAKDIVQALEWCEKAAEQGLADAQLMVGRFYEEGWGTPKDAYRSFLWYEKAAEKGKAEAQYVLAKCYETGNGVNKDKNKAYEWYVEAANQGFVDAQYRVGECCSLGIGVTKNLSIAVDWYKLAAEQGKVEAQFDLAKCYEEGKGVNADGNAAFIWYKKAAEQGFIDAQYDVARCYFKGIGITKNEDEGFRIYKELAEQGEIRAQKIVGKLYYQGRGTEKNEDESFKWYEKAANQDDAEAQLVIADYFFNGIGTRKMEAGAFRLYEMLAKRGNIHAQYKLTSCYENGQGVEKNEALALNLYRELFDSCSQLAFKGDPIAQYILAMCYLKDINKDGDGINYSKACEWLRLSALQGNADAQYQLSLCYTYGDGVTKNLNEAVKWCELAIENGNEQAKEYLVAIKNGGEAVYQDIITEYDLDKLKNTLTKEQRELVAKRFNSRKKDKKIAYILSFILLGRFYLGDYLVGLLFLCTYGLFLFGWYRDLKTLSVRVDEVNRKIEEKIIIEVINESKKNENSF